MSRFNEIQEKASDMAEVTKNRIQAAVEHTKAEFHEAEAEAAEDRAENVGLGSNRENRLRTTAA